MRVAGLVLGVLVAAAVVLALFVAQFHGIFIGVGGWAVMLVFIGLGSWLGAAIPRHCVAPPREIVVHRDRILVPRAFGGPPDEVLLGDLELQVNVRHVTTSVLLEGRLLPVAFAQPVSVEIGHRERPRTIHAATFAEVSHPTRLADDVRRLRAGIEPRAHDQLGPEDMLNDAQGVIDELLRGKPKDRSGDEYDQRLDEELRALDAPKKSGKE